MNTGAKNMLAQVYEIEGLLLIADNRGAETPVQVLEMLREKVEQLQQSVEAFELPQAELRHIEAPTTLSQPLITPQTDAECISEPVPADEEDLPDDDIEVEFVDEDDPDSFLFRPLVYQENQDEDLPESLQDTELAETQPDPEVQPEPDERIEPEEQPEPDEQIEPEEQLEPEVFADSLWSEFSQEEPEHISSPQEVTHTEPIKLDEALQINLSKDLRKAFTLNDRFRYRRELFSNSDLEMNETLNLVGAMQSYAEAEDYFVNDLQWDVENPDVEGFMSVIKKYFM